MVETEAWLKLHNVIVDKWNAKEVLSYEEAEMMNLFMKEYEKMLEEKGDNFVVKIEDLEKLIKYK